MKSYTYKKIFIFTVFTLLFASLLPTPTLAKDYNITFKACARLEGTVNPPIVINKATLHWTDAVGAHPASGDATLSDEDVGCFVGTVKVNFDNQLQTTVSLTGTQGGKAVGPYTATRDWNGTSLTNPATITVPVKGTSNTAIPIVDPTAALGSSDTSNIPPHIYGKLFYKDEENKVNVLKNFPFKVFRVNPDGSQEEIEAYGKASDTAGKTDDDGEYRTRENLDEGMYKITVDRQTLTEDFEDTTCIFGFLGPTGGTCAALKLQGFIKGFLDGKGGDTEWRWMGSETVIVKRKDGEAVAQNVNKDVAVSLVEISPLAKAMASATSIVGKFIAFGIQIGVQSINKLLFETQGYVLTDEMKNSWADMRNIGLSLLVLALLIIAFANVLQIDIERYGLNRMIPKIIVAIIMSYLSWMVVVFFFDFSNAIQAASLGIIQGKKSALQQLGTISLTNPNPVDVMSSIAMFIFAIVVCFLILVSVVTLLFSLLLRVVVLAFLLVAAPLAFIFSIMPFTETLYKRWWSEFFKWMFMGPIAVAIISIGTLIASGTGGGDYATFSISPDSIKSTDVLLNLLMLAATLVFAARLPLLWGGKMMQSWRDFGKKMWGTTGGAGLKFAGRSAWYGIGGEKSPGRRLRQLKSAFTGGFERKKQEDVKKGLEMRSKLAKNSALRKVLGEDEISAHLLAEAAVSQHVSKYDSVLKSNNPSDVILGALKTLDPNSAEFHGLARAVFNNKRPDALGMGLLRMQNPNDQELLEFLDRDTGGVISKELLRRRYRSEHLAETQDLTDEQLDVSEGFAPVLGRRNAVDKRVNNAAADAGIQLFNDREIREKLTKEQGQIVVSNYNTKKQAGTIDEATAKAFDTVISEEQGKSGRDISYKVIGELAGAYKNALANGQQAIAQEMIKTLRTTYSDTQIKEAAKGTKKLKDALEKNLHLMSDAQVEYYYQGLGGKVEPDKFLGRSKCVEQAINAIHQAQQAGQSDTQMEATLAKLEQRFRTQVAQGNQDNFQDGAGI